MSDKIITLLFLKWHWYVPWQNTPSHHRQAHTIKTTDGFSFVSFPSKKWPCLLWGKHICYDLNGGQCNFWAIWSKRGSMCLDIMPHKGNNYTVVIDLAKLDRKTFKQFNFPLRLIKHFLIQFNSIQNHSGRQVGVKISFSLKIFKRIFPQHWVAQLVEHTHHVQR